MSEKQQQGEWQDLPRRSVGCPLVAIESKIVVSADGRETERIIAGISRVVPEHWLACEHPELFEAVKPGKARTKQPAGLARELQVRKRTIAASPVAAPAARKPSPPSEPKKWKPLVRFNPTAEPSFTIVLSSNARSLMAELAFLARGAHETGGALFGPPARSSSRKGEVRIAQVRLARLAMRVRVGVPVAGHPLEHYVALILTPRRDWHRHDHEPYMSWVKPMLHAWHMRQLSDDQFTCRRAVIADEGQSQWRL